MGNYRLGVGIILVNNESQIFVGKRFDPTQTSCWQMPQGGIDEGEDPISTAFREAREEIGTDKMSIIVQSKDWYKYEVPEELIIGYWQGKYIGQKQKWFLMKFEGDDSDININTPEPEFSHYKWVKPTQLSSLVVDFKKKLYEDLLVEFTPYIDKL